MFSKKKPYENDDFFDSNSRQNYETEEKPEKDSFFKANLLLNEDKKRDISISEDKKKGEKFYNNDNPLDMYYKEPKSNMHVSKPMAEMNKTSNYPLDFSKKPDNLNLSSAFNKSGVPNDEKSFVNKYRDNIRKIFDECSERGEIEINKLKGLLLEADVNKAFSILTKKLENTEKRKKDFGGSKKRDDILRYDDFEKLFEFDLKKEKDFDILFDTIDELGNNSNSIGLAELEQANKHYDLGLSSEDMEIMLKYIGKDPNVVTKEELKKAMGVMNMNE